MTKPISTWQNKPLSFFAVCGLALTLCSASIPVAHGKSSDEERTKICGKAEKRYQKLFGKASSDEDVTIVMMHKFTFCPSKITVKRGTKVRFINVDKRTSHSVWFKEEGKPESDRLFGEEFTEITFDGPPAVYPYLCGPHWESDGMIGTVTVTP